MAHHRIVEEAQCKLCQATGLYVGFAEKPGAAVVCRTCKGSGKVDLVFEWDDFEERQVRQGVERVFAAQTGYALTPSAPGGVPYSAWLVGAPLGIGTEDRQRTCPAWFYQQADPSQKPDWDECMGCGVFTACKHFPEKSVCWERFDSEQEAHK